MLSKKIEDSIQRDLQQLLQDGRFRTYTGDSSEQLAAELSALTGTTECLLVSSGTAGLEICLRAAGIGPGDEVLISAYDYPGNFWAIERVGALPVLLDTEADSWRISRAQLESLAAKSVNACKALVVSHLHGQLQDAAWLRHYCDSQGLLFVEDCCQAIGANLAGRPAGSLGHAAILSFGGTKLISAGRGGALVTDDKRLAQRARLAAGAGSGPYALSEIQATLISSQLAWLSDLNQCSARFFDQFQHQLIQSPGVHDKQIIMPGASQIHDASFYQAGWLIDLVPTNLQTGSPPADQSGESHLLSLIGALRSLKIPAGTGFQGFHRRSNRRCRAAFSLENVRHVVARTLVIHHRAALDETWSASEMAHALLNEIRCSA